MRGQIIVRTSLVGIVVNILLAAFKAAVGLTANSIAVLLDAVNNLSDALSSVPNSRAASRTRSIHSAMAASSTSAP